MTTAFLIAFLALYCFASAKAALYYLHMFQLNGYITGEQIHWIYKNPLRAVPLLAVLLIDLLLLTLPNISFFSILPPLSLLFLVFCFFYTEKNSKKPLVFTKRVKRLLVTISLCMLVPVAAGLFINGVKAASVLACLLYFLTPFVIIAANFINKPIEYTINQHYINEAKGILKSAKNLTIIGITGSYGKTSVKFYLNTLLRSKFNVLMTPESFNTPMGIVKTIRGQLRATHEIFICEMGARYIHEIGELCDIVHPKHGVLTSIGPQHLETFKSLENIIETKFELADSLPPDGLLFLNGDNKYIRENNKNPNAVFYGIDSECPYSAFDLKLSEKGTEFSVTAPGGEVCRYSTRLIGKHNVLNILGAIAVSHSMGIPLDGLIAPVRKLECVPHRLELNSKGGMVIIDDAYNSNPNGTKVALETLGYFSGMKIIVTPGMVELGAKQDDYNFEFGVDIAAVCDYAVLVGEHQTKSIHNGLLKAGYPKDKIFTAKSIDKALEFVHNLNGDGKRKIVLLENDLPDNY